MGVGARVPGLPAAAARTAPASVLVPNDGLVCFLYDAANAAAIERCSPPILERFDPEESAEEPRLRALALRGSLVAYELYREEPISVQISVGAPFSSQELKSGRWLPPQMAYLELPSGMLRVDSYASLPFGAAIPSARGGRFHCAPGGYILTLLRFDWYGRRMFSRMFEAPTSELIRLTPVGAARLPNRPKPMLLYPERPVLAWEGQWQVCGGAFQGQLVGEVGALNSVAINLDRDAAARIGLGPGMRLRARAGQHEYEALYAGDIRIDQIVERYGSYTLGELRAASPFLAYMDHWQRPRRRHASTVVVLSGGATGEYDFSGLREGTSVTVTIDGTQMEPLPWTRDRS